MFLEPRSVCMLLNPKLVKLSSSGPCSTAVCFPSHHLPCQGHKACLLRQVLRLPPLLGCSLRSVVSQVLVGSPVHVILLLAILRCCTAFGNLESSGTFAIPTSKVQRLTGAGAVLEGKGAPLWHQGADPITGLASKRGREQADEARTLAQLVRWNRSQTSLPSERACWQPAGQPGSPRPKALDPKRGLFPS